MIRILTSLVAVLTVTSIQSQTSLSQLSKILSEGRIDELSGTCINQIFKHSLSLHYKTELYNGGFIITSYDNDYDAVSDKNSFVFLLENKENNPSGSLVISKPNRFDYHSSVIYLLKQNNKTVEFLLSSNRKAKSGILVQSILSKKTSNDFHLEYLIPNFLDSNTTNPLFYTQNKGFNSIFSFITYNVSTVQRIRSPGSEFFS